MRENRLTFFFCNLFPTALVLGLNYDYVKLRLCNLKLHKINANITENKNVDCLCGMQYCKTSVELQNLIFIVSFYIFHTRHLISVSYFICIQNVSN